MFLLPCLPADAHEEHILIMPRLDALGVTPQVRAALGSDVETAEELFMMAPGGRGGGGGMRGTGLGKQVCMENGRG